MAKRRKKRNHFVPQFYLKNLKQYYVINLDITGFISAAKGSVSYQP